MKRKGRVLLAALLLWAVLLPLCAGAALAEEPAAGAPEELRDVRVFVDGLLCGRALADGETVWFAVEDLCALLGVQSETWWNEDSGELVVSGAGFVLHASAGAEYLSVNSRYLYETRGFFVRDGRSWLPTETIARIFGAAPKLSSDGLRADFKGEELAIMPGGAAWYYDNFGSAEIFWLARIIHSEAGGQPLAGRIGVGNVVLNRVASDRYPDEVFGVVFDDKFAVQFDPAYTGSVYQEPGELDVVAACLCLEGYNTVGESMYFVNPDRADDSWFRNTKDFVIRIGDHEFYKLRG
ncbi:MAG: cell wall hydrolase [Oscillospiraceae bacterium]|nr:cell wall hydrolase [Oscillospiraceae bacterium]